MMAASTGFEERHPAGARMWLLDVIVPAAGVFLIMWALAGYWLLALLVAVPVATFYALGVRRSSRRRTVVDRDGVRIGRHRLPAHLVDEVRALPADEVARNRGDGGAWGARRVGTNGAAHLVELRLRSPEGLQARWIVGTSAPQELVAAVEELSGAAGPREAAGALPPPPALPVRARPVVRWDWLVPLVGAVLAIDAWLLYTEGVAGLSVVVALLVVRPLLRRARLDAQGVRIGRRRLGLDEIESVRRLARDEAEALEPLLHHARNQWHARGPALVISGGPTSGRREGGSLRRLLVVGGPDLDAFEAALRAALPDRSRASGQGERDA
jgi:membrane protein implicated in regulation of membrane protease activity